jgi:hypothetical protein
MREHLIRVQGPAVAIVIEAEAPSRVIPFTGGNGDHLRLWSWVNNHPHLDTALMAALLDETADPERVEAWRRSLASDPGGVTEAMIELLDRAIGKTGDDDP